MIRSLNKQLICAMQSAGLFLLAALAQNNVLLSVGSHDRKMCDSTANGLCQRIISCAFACLLFLAPSMALAANVGDILDSSAEVRYNFNGQVY